MNAENHEYDFPASAARALASHVWDQFNITPLSPRQIKLVFASDA